MSCFSRKKNIFPQFSSAGECERGKITWLHLAYHKHEENSEIKTPFNLFYCVFLFSFSSKLWWQTECEMPRGEHKVTAQIVLGFTLKFKSGLIWIFWPLWNSNLFTFQIFEHVNCVGDRKFKSFALNNQNINWSWLRKTSL